MQGVIAGLKKDIDKEIALKIQRMRNQIQVIMVATQEITAQLIELTDSVSDILNDIRKMEAELSSRKKSEDRKESKKQGEGKITDVK